MDRRAQRDAFVAQTDWRHVRMDPLAGDASARRYFRLSQGGQTAVLMDAPTEGGASIMPFLDITKMLEGFGLCPPKIIASDPLRGFILMEDLGDALFSRIIAAKPELESPLYLAAVDVLAKLDALEPSTTVPNFTVDDMVDQVSPVYEWYRKALTGDEGSERMKTFQAVLGSVLSATIDPRPTLLLRDFHAENLVWLPDRQRVRRVGLLDYQDAMMGPAGYDLVSMLQDARRDVSEHVIDHCLAEFVTKTGRTRASFDTAYAVIGLQRNLRILGIFVRLGHRDGKPRYIDFIPRVWGYVQDSLRHPALAELAQIIAQDLPAPDKAALERLRATCPTQ